MVITKKTYIKDTNKKEKGTKACQHTHTHKINKTQRKTLKEEKRHKRTTRQTENN